MSEPIQFPEANALWTGEGDTGSLPAHLTPQGESISKWELTMEERLEILATGVVWLHVWGTHPAVDISAFEPTLEPSHSNYSADD